MTATMPDIRVVPYEPAYRASFRDLNLEWITAHFEVEEEDRRVLDDPEGEILAPGGTILIALEGGRTIGTGALIRTGPQEFELAKMAVTAHARGRGVGRALCQALIALARDRGAVRLELMSQTTLAPALQLYRSLGFVEVPLGPAPYKRANIRMALEL